MAILKSKKLRELGEKELEEKLRELQLELSKARASSEVGGTVKSPGRIKEIRRTIARIKTYRSMKGRVEGSRGVSMSRSGEKHDTENLKSEDRGGKK